MKLCVASPGLVEVVMEPPVISTATHEVVVHPVMSGICATDLEIIDGTIDPAYVRYPVVIGHEFVGRLHDELGEHLVVVEGIIPCGYCPACRRGQSNLCETYDEIGFTRPGALAQEIVVPAHLVHRLDESVDVLDAVLTEPLAVVWRSLSRATLREGGEWLIIGDGTIALLAAVLARQFLPTSITMVGRRDEQETLARAVGVDRFMSVDTAETFDIVIEASGNPHAAQSVIARTRRGGLVIVLGLTPHSSTVQWHLDDLVNNDLTVQGSFGYDRRAWSDVVNLLNTRAISPGQLVTHVFDFADWAQAIECLRHGAGTQARGKVAVRLPR